MGGIGPLLIYQTLARGVAFLLCAGIGALVWVPAAYFLGPVILLERGRMAGVPGRCLALARRAFERILLLLVIDAALLGVGWLAGLWFLDSFVSLWRGVSLVDVLWAAFDPAAEDGDAALVAVQAIASWPSQIAFWTAAALVTVYRFFTYLDTRIRHEGWDVELAFRTPATYAGLRIGRAAAGAALAAGLLVQSAAPLAAALPAEAAGVKAADPARDAVAKQRFPWYDAATDAYRPMIHVVPKAAPVSDIGFEGLGIVAKGVMIAVLVVLVVGAVWLVVRHGLDRRGANRPKRSSPAAVLGAEVLEALPEAARRHDGDLLAEAERLAAAGDHAAAMVLFHGW
ncbi:MAG: hypothetical protein EBR23_03395 [Planctomycetia bacterium]|nr:hypothetical protein [Planctomycetia bacterium]